MTSLTPPLRRSLHHHRTFSSNAARYSTPRQGIQVRRSAPPPRPRPPLPKSAAEIDALIAELESSETNATNSPAVEESAPSAALSSPPPIRIRSPLIKSEGNKSYLERHPKVPEQRPHTAFHSALIKNPFAHMLASPIRNDQEFQLRLPSALLARFTPKRHPDTKENWILPDDNFRGTGRGAGGYALGTKTAIERFGRKRGAMALRLISVERRETFAKQGKWVWREDMEQVIQKNMVKEIFRRLVETGWKWGRDLEWSTEERKPEDEKEKKRVLGMLDWEDAGGPRVITVDGAVVPCFNMRDMIGEEKVVEISNIWIGKGEHWLQGTRTLIYSTNQTTGLVTELMRLRAYLEMWETYDEEEGELPSYLR